MIPRLADLSVVVLYAALVAFVAWANVTGNMNDTAALVALGAGLPASILALKRVRARGDGTLT